MAKVDSESRCRIGIVWYDDLAEAEKAGKNAQTAPGFEEANVGYVTCGRDSGFDKTVDGKPAYAVVVP